jgi:hypothetical protein
MRPTSRSPSKTVIVLVLPGAAFAEDVGAAKDQGGVGHAWQSAWGALYGMPLVVFYHCGQLFREGDFAPKDLQHGVILLYRIGIAAAFQVHPAKGVCVVVGELVSVRISSSSHKHAVLFEILVDLVPHGIAPAIPTRALSISAAPSRH